MDEFKQIATEFLQMVSDELDQYTTEDGKIEIESSTRVVLLTPAHIQFARYGRAPGKQPPISSILDFVKKKGIIFDGTDQEGTAWAIAKSIAKNGTKNYVSNAPNALNEAIQNNVDAYNKKLADHMAVEANEELQAIYKNVFPQKITIKL